MDFLAVDQRQHVNDSEVRKRRVLKYLLNALVADNLLPFLFQP